MVFVMVVEDNPNDATNLQKTISRMRPDITYVVCRDGSDAIAYLKNSNQDIDIFFLDVNLPTMNGYDLAREIRKEKKYLLTPIVFVTGYANNALDAFQEYHCYSFIQKPFNENTIKKNLHALFEVFQKGNERGKNKLRKLLYIPARDEETFIYADQIIALEVVRKDCVIYTMDSKYIVPRKSLEEELREIGNPDILRCHKSFALNVAHMKGLTKVRRNLWEPKYDATDQDIKCYVSGTYYESVMERYKKLLTEAGQSD